MAQVKQDWVARYRTYNDSIGEEATAQAIDEKGNVYVAGGAVGTAPNRDYTTIKYNTAGVLQWKARYSSPAGGDSYPSAIAVDKKGNVYVTGYSAGVGSGEDYATVKYNAAGVQQWVARYNGPAGSDDGAAALLVDNDGNVYVTGSSMGKGTLEDYATIKYGPNGVAKWISRYNGPANSTDWPAALVLDRNGNVLVTGQSVGKNSGLDYATIKYNSSGVQKWVARFNGKANDEDYAASVAVDKGGNVYVTGTTYSGYIPDDPFDLPLLDIATIKYNAAGAQQWVAIHDETGGTDEARSVKLDKDGNAYVMGRLFNSNQYVDDPDVDYGVIKYNPAGVKLWVAKYGPPADKDFECHANDQVVDEDGNVYVTGQDGVEEFATVKFDKYGKQKWAVTYKKAVNQYAIAVDVDHWGNVYVTGNGDRKDCQGCMDFVTIKYSQCDKAVSARMGEPAENQEVTGRFKVTVAPNPAAGSTKFYYEMPVDGQVSIQVFDVLGRQIATLVNANQQAGLHNTEWDVSPLKSGIYIYHIVVKSGKTVWNETGRISVIK
ncbi:hypothetical protein A4D02_16115 [Niastella koreensis]|nr:hypothetical protein A4D02_16115 [Niastella koreensis]